MLRLWGPLCQRTVLWEDCAPTRSLGLLVCSVSYLVFQLRVHARLPVISVGRGKEMGVPTNIVPGTDLQLPHCLQSTPHSCPPSYLLAQSPEPSGVPGQIGSLDPSSIPKSSLVSSSFQVAFWSILGCSFLCLPHPSTQFHLIF